jgi:Acetyl-coenzyme A transporter 1
MSFDTIDLIQGVPVRCLLQVRIALVSRMQTNRLGLLSVRSSTSVFSRFISCPHGSGSIPFILRSHLSYSQIGIFALSGYPYSLKLIWSPIVDSIFFRKIGRRKSWIVPMQLIIGSLMLWIAHHSEELMDSVSLV